MYAVLKIAAGSPVAFRELRYWKLSSNCGESGECRKSAFMLSNAFTAKCNFFMVKLIACPIKVEISERFKGHRLEFKGQSSNLKHAEKIDE